MFLNGILSLEELQLPSQTTSYCRLCLTEENLMELGSFGKVLSVAVTNHDSTAQLVQLIYECTNVKLSLVDEPDCAICGGCQRALAEFHRFRSQAKRVDELIKSRLVENSFKPTGNVNETDKTDDLKPQLPVDNSSPSESAISHKLLSKRNYSPTNGTIKPRPRTKILKPFLVAVANGGKHKCRYCPKSFHTSNGLAEHARLHNRPHQCPNCLEQFQHAPSLARHVRNRTCFTFTKYRCRVCAESFLEQGHWVEHIKIHAVDFPYQCQECLSQFKHKATLRRHVNTVHLLQY
ncbi:zinc finger protein Xfin-like [Sabethes cyaneus]|uniref:zinc finger protein Xfin-like n=1 Tax=Sabethes cyaneus TaxID=53552 RepID=UPI00237EA5FE|nr:zinc finger protein Xfin-like [Sabethes cyaneus]XP_053698366.1 zinc finger protein Xfin-like [Sabethes cyaneus]